LGGFGEVRLGAKILECVFITAWSVFTEDALYENRRYFL